MSKQKIIAEIRRLAIANNGKPPGVRMFEREAGIKQSDLFPYLWLRWSEALAEAGFSANKWTPRIGDEILLERYIDLVRELGRFPIKYEMLRESRRDKTFPSDKAYRRFGGKEKLIDAVAAYCRDKPEYEDVVVLCDARQHSTITNIDADGKAKLAIGCVYLVKSGRHYKIGRTNSISRRGGEL